MQDETGALVPALPTPQRPPANPVRKEAMLREDQIEQLARLRRALAGRRRRRSERITDNLLLRLAVDHLLADAGKLAGDTEQELWESLSNDREPPVTSRKK
jgi:hypothetical protein